METGKEARVGNCEWLNWTGCYSSSLKGVVADAAFAHPAKFAHGLITRIIEFGLERGYFKRGDTLVDPFAGVGVGGIVAAYHGMRWYGVELEAKFVSLAEQSFAMHRRNCETFGDPLPVIIQGDSRKFATLIREATGAVSSPPYANSLEGSDDSKHHLPGKAALAARAGRVDQTNTYSGSPCNIGNLKEGSVDSVLSSPPYADSDHAAISSKGNSGSIGRDYKVTGKGPRERDVMVNEMYGTTPGQIGVLPAGDLSAAVTSPPFSPDQPCASQSQAKQDYHAFTRGEVKIARLTAEGKLAEAEVVRQHGSGANSNLRQEGYGVAAGQIGVEQAESYWMAVSQVYSEVRKALKPGGIFCLVCKDFIRAGERVPLCEQTCTLLERLGFTVFLRCRAWMVTDTTEATIFGGEKTTRKSKKSFFRRLYEKSHPENSIDFEEVLFARSPTG